MSGSGSKKIDCKYVNIMYTNADVLTKNKLIELKSRVRDQNPHIILVSEVKPKRFKRKLTAIEYAIEGYHLETLNLDKEEGRGLCTYIRNGLEVKEYKFDAKLQEYNAFTVQVNKDEVLLIVNVYRSGSSDEENCNALNNLLLEISKNTDFNYVALAGDINYKDIDWEVGTCKGSITCKEFKFMEAVKDAFFKQHIDKPTRGRGSDKPSTLDLFITRDDDVLDDIIINSPLGKSDHAVIIVKFKCNFETVKKTKTKYLYDKANFEKMRDMLSINWEEELGLDDQNSDVNCMWDKFRNKVKQAEDECIPRKTVCTNGNNKPAKHTTKLDRKSMSKIKRKDRLWEQYCKTRDGRVYLDYCKSRNQVRNLTRKAKKIVERDICRQAKSNPKKFWWYVGSKTKKKVTIPDLLIEDEDEPRYTRNDQEKANVLNDKFASVFNHDEPLYTRVIPDKTFVKIVDIKIDEEMVKKKLLDLKIGKSPGPDGMHPRVLKEITLAIVKPLTLIYKESLKVGQLPDDWKSANIAAIYKKGSRHIALNYRPVSLTCIACKMLESILRDHIIKHMKKHKLFSSKQFGFISGRSTTLQLLRVLDEWTSILDRGSAVDVIYFDFMKAFDKVPHERLIMKLRSYGVDGALLQWIRAFLTDRKQRVVINGTQSDWVNVTSGVPQGSVLGPLLFVVYINDLPDVIDNQSSLYMFADDTKLFREITTVQDNDTLQIDIDEMNDWSLEWQMFYHPDKCHVMKLGTRAASELRDMFVPYELGGHALDVVTSETDLGVTIDCGLTFEKHVAGKCTKANQLLGIIRRTFMHIDRQMFLNLYKAMVRPHLEYANQVWSNRSKKHVEMVEKVQMRATKLVPGKIGNEEDYEKRLKMLKLPTLCYRRLRGGIIELYKILTGKYDPDVCEGFIDLRGESNTRGSSLKIFKHRPRLDVRKYSFPHRIVDIWNDIPEKVINASTVVIFESRLDKFWYSQDLKYDYKAKYKFGGIGSAHIPEVSNDLVPEASN